MEGELKALVLVLRRISGQEFLLGAATIVTVEGDGDKTIIHCVDGSVPVANNSYEEVKGAWRFGVKTGDVDVFHAHV